MPGAFGYDIKVACEGSSDYWFLSGLFEAALAEKGVDPAWVTITPLHPSHRIVWENEPGPSGWQSVRTWCRDHGTRDITFMLKASLAVTVMVDGDVARKVEPDLSCGPSPSERASALCGRIKSEWLRHQNTAQVPDGLLIVIPTDELETWMLAALGFLASDPTSENIQNTKEQLHLRAEAPKNPDELRALGIAAWKKRAHLRSLPSFATLEVKLSNILERRLA